MGKRITFWATWMALVVSLLVAGGASGQSQAWSVGRPDAPEVAAAFSDAGGSTGTAIDVYANPLAVRSAQEVTSTVYLPLVSKNYFEAYVYQDNFQDWGTGWVWGTSPFYYGYKQDGDGSKVYYIRLDDQYETAFVTGPSLQAYALGNFEYEVWLRRGPEQPLFWYDEYGILLSPTPIDPANPAGANAYTFHIKLQIAPGYYPRYAIAKWSALHRDHRTIFVETQESDYITDSAKVWNKLKIVRIGNKLDFYVTREGKSDWKFVHSRIDDTLPFKLHVGFYAMHSKEDMGKYEIEFQYDNLRLSAHP